MPLIALPVTAPADDDRVVDLAVRRAAAEAAVRAAASAPVRHLPAALLESAAFTPRVLADVRRRGWASSVAEREQGVASVSAPVRGRDGNVVAAVSVSGPLERLTRSPGRLHAEAVVAAAAELSREAG